MFKREKQIKILCCPFCGSTEVNFNKTNPKANWISCNNCEAQTESGKNRREAIRKWNRRCNSSEPAKIVYDDDKE